MTRIQIPDPSQQSPRLTDPLSETAIEVEGLGKRYLVYDRPQHRLLQMLGRGRRMFGREFWAARGVTFRVRKGEMFGIIGRNGSGKSTVLQLLAGTLAATEGTIRIRGRIGALLELGSGFNPDFTGRENVMLNGAIIGLGRREMEERFDAIEGFADIGEFIDQPVRLYSSGMFVRLAFAVATCLDADVLLIDEALAVGDIFFRQKCYQRLEQLRERGVSIVLVSHAMGDILQYCENAILLDRGDVLYLGPSSEAVERYYLLDQAEHHRLPVEAERPVPPPTPSSGDFSWPASHCFPSIAQKVQVTDGKARCTAAALCNSEGSPAAAFEQGELGYFYYEFETLEDLEIPIGGVQIQNDRGVIVHGKNSLQHGSTAPKRVAKGTRIRFRQVIGLELAIGEYTFDVGLTCIDSGSYELRETLSHTELDSYVSRLCQVPKVGTFSVVWRRTGPRRQLLHHGVANLPGECRIAVVAGPRSE
jgi:lipopolysaccharide transport system ATP-binding protein